MSRAQYVEAAKKALESGDADTACKNTLALIPLGTNFSVEERGLLFAAFKGATAKRRGEIQRGGNPNAKAELATYCADAINAFQAVVPSAQDHESKVFYYKALGDFYRYYDEVQPDKTNKEAALQCYQTATEWAASGLAPTNPLRLNVALNFGVYYHETIGNPKQGLQITVDAIEAARAPLLTLTEEKDKAEASFVLQLLFDNARLWSTEAGLAAPREIDGLYVPKAPQGAPQGGAPGYTRPN